MAEKMEKTDPEEEWEEVVALDGKTYRVLKNPPPPTPPLPLTAKEEKAIDDAIDIMAKLFKRRRIEVERARFVNKEKKPCKAIDKLLAETLLDLKRDVPEEPAEKLFDRLSTVSLNCEDEDRALVLGTIFIRFMDTMEYMVSFKGKFRGRARERSKYTKKEALEALRKRGLTRK